MVDNRYTGVGYEPPFETPTDKDFMAAHIEQLQLENSVLHERLSKLIQTVETFLEIPIADEDEKREALRELRDEITSAKE